MAVASPSLVRLALPRTMLRASCLTASSQAPASCSSSQSMSYTTLPLRLSKCRAASIRSPSQRRFSMTPRQRRPPQPTPPVGAPAAEPAVVKSPADPPNPASWPGLQKKAGSDAQRSSASQHDPFAGSSEKQGGTASVPHAESSKGALERQQREAAQGEDTGSTNSDAAACATLSPSSPASPRSQGKEKASAASTADETSSAPKAVAPEDSQTSASSKTSGGSKFAAPNASGKAFRAKKEALTLSPTAVERLQELLQSESGPRLIRIGVRNKGCAGMSYHLEYVTPDQAGKFDERVRQDGVEVLIDSKALFSIIGSEMDWKEDTLSAKFVFNNPNVKESCGCGESFLT